MIADTNARAIFEEQARLTNQTLNKDKELANLTGVICEPEDNDPWHIELDRASERQSLKTIETHEDKTNKSGE